MPDKAHRNAAPNRVFKSLHSLSPTWASTDAVLLRMRRRLVRAFNPLQSHPCSVSPSFIGGFAFGHWVRTSDPAFLRILATVRNAQAAL